MDMSILVLDIPEEVLYLILVWEDEELQLMAQMHSANNF